MKWNYPLAEKIDFEFEFAGHRLKDPYAWMEANDERTKKYTAAQNAFTDAWFEARTDVSKRAAELADKADKPSYPDVTEAHGRLYATRRMPDGGISAVILDLDFNLISLVMDQELSEGQFQVYRIVPSPADPNLAALAILKNGAARPSVRIVSLSTRETLAELDGLFSFVWAPDGRHLYYADAVADPMAGTNSNTVRSYSLGDGVSRLLYTEKDNAVFIMLEMSEQGDLFAHVNLSYVNIRLVHLNPLSGEATVMTVHDDNVVHYVGSLGNVHYFFSDEEAPRGKLLALAGSLSLTDAVTVLAEENRILGGVTTAGDNLVAVYLEDAVSQMELYSPEGRFLRILELPDSLGSLELSAEYPPVRIRGASALYLNFESFICPPSVLRLDFQKGSVSIVYSTRNEGLREDFLVTSHGVTARDGTEIRAFLVRKKGSEGPFPALMYGYGGYNVSLTPSYTAPFMGLDAVDWADRGGLYVQAVLRGGGEYGSLWHEAGWRDSKKNAFTDFIDIGDWLVQEGWTLPGKLAINGGSNGGLLVTSALTMRPDLFGAVIASVPHTDMLRFALDDRGPMYITEYGDPRDPRMFDYMYSYSPYHNIQEGTAYPPVYLQTGEFDNNVPPYHAKKFAAKLQDRASSSPVLLRVLARGSHDLGTGSVYYRTSAEMQLFAEYALGMTSG